MSNWVHISGCIKIDGIKTIGLKEMYNLKNKKEYDKFFENSNNWKHKYDKKRNRLQIDHRKGVEKLVETLSKPTGSEGGIEAQVCFYENHYKIWGRDSTSSETRDYNVKTGELIPFGYSIDIDGEEYKKDGWKDVWFEARGDRFVICVFGNLRDRDLDTFKKEFDNFLEMLERYFELEDVNVEASEDWNGNIGRWSYTGEIIKYKQLTHQHEDKGE